MKRIILFTRKYPYGFHETFLDVELQYLSQEFDHIVIFPNQSAPTVRDVPENVKVDTTMSLKEMGKVQYFIKAIFSISHKLFIHEISRKINCILSPKALWRIILNLEEASRVQRYLRKLNKTGELEPGNTILYTYWLCGQSLGVSLLKEEYPELVFVSRVHRGDLYEESHHPPYLPFRNEMYKNVDRIFPVSQDGFDYLKKKYCDMKIHAVIARLGVEDPGFTTAGSCDGVLRVVSCSTLKSVKRIDLLIEGLSEFSRLSPDNRVEWDHLGSGPLHEYLLHFAEEKLNDDIKWRFMGQLPHEQVIGYYRSNPVDIFINVSSSEGIPVSIMEAQSCGIPVIATAVGGTPEIVNNHNGRILKADPCPNEIAQAIQDIIADMARKKTNSRRQWEEKYHAKKNYQIFVNELNSLLG